MKAYKYFVIAMLILAAVLYLSCVTQHFKAADELAKSRPQYAEAELVFNWEDGE